MIRRRHATRLVLLVGLAACHTAPSAARRTPTTTPAGGNDEAATIAPDDDVPQGGRPRRAPPVQAPSSVAPSPTRVPSVVRVEIDLDGDGAMEVAEVDPAARRLRLAGADLAIDISDFPDLDSVDDLVASTFTARAVDVEPQVPGQQLLISQRVGEDDDPGSTHALFGLRDGAVVPLWTWSGGGRPTTALWIVGDGTIVHREDDAEACQRLGYPRQAARQDLVWRIDEVHGLVTSETPRTTAELAPSCDLPG